MNSESRPIVLRCLLVALFALMLTLPWIGRKPFSTRGEPREALVAQSMLLSGNWILPNRYGDEFATKPPAAHWMMALTAKLLGPTSEAAMRFPSTAWSIVVLIVFFFFAVRAVGVDRATFACIVLLGSVEWHRASIACRVDMTLSGFLVVGLLSMFLWLRNGGVRFWAFAVVGFVGATLSKGPVAIALPGLILGLYQLFNKTRLPEIVRQGLILFVPVTLLSSIWYLLAYANGGQEFLDVFLSENLGRLTGTMQKGADPHQHSFVYLWMTIPIGFLPWTLALIPSVPRLFKQDWRKLLRISGLRGWYSGLSTEYRFAVVVIAVFIGFFSIPSSKRSVYLLPIYPFLSLFVADYLLAAARKSERGVRILSLSFVAFVFVIYAILGIALSGSINPAWFGREKTVVQVAYFIGVLHDLVRNISFLDLLLTLLPIFVALWSWSVLRRRQQVRAVAVGAIATFFAVLLALNAVFLPVFGAALSSKRFVQEIEPIVKNETTLYSYGKQYPANFYLENRLQPFSAKRFYDKEGFIVVVSTEVQNLQEDLGPGYTTAIQHISPNAVRKATERLLLVKVEPVKAYSEDAPSTTARAKP